MYLMYNVVHNIDQSGLILSKTNPSDALMSSIECQSHFIIKQSVTARVTSFKFFPACKINCTAFVKSIDRNWITWNSTYVHKTLH